MGAEGSTGSRGCWHRLLWGHPEKQQHCLGTAGGSSQRGASVKPLWVGEHVERDRRAQEHHSNTATNPRVAQTLLTDPNPSPSHCPVLPQSPCTRTMNAVKALFFPPLISKPLANTAIFAPRLNSHATTASRRWDQQCHSTTPLHPRGANHQGASASLQPEPQSPAGPLLPPEAPRGVHQCLPPTMAQSSSICPGTCCTCQNRGLGRGAWKRGEEEDEPWPTPPSLHQLPPPPVRFSAEGLKAR